MKILDHPNICKLYESFQDHRDLMKNISKLSKCQNDLCTAATAAVFFFLDSWVSRNPTEATSIWCWSCAPVVSCLTGSLSMATSPKSRPSLQHLTYLGRVQNGSKFKEVQQFA